MSKNENQNEVNNALENGKSEKKITSTKKTLPPAFNSFTDISLRHSSNDTSPITKNPFDTIREGKETDQKQSKRRDDPKPASTTKNVTSIPCGATPAGDLYTELKNAREVELQQTIAERDSRIRDLENEIIQLKTSLEEKTRRDRAKKKRKTCETDEDQTMDIELPQVSEAAGKSLDTEKIIKSMESFLDKKLVSIDNRFTKIEASIKVNNSLCAQPSQETKSYANVLSKNIQPSVLSNVLTAVKNSEKVEQTERQKRERNIIIYGPKLGDQESCESYVNDFLKVVGVSTVPKEICRIGKSDANKIQPIKITLSNTEFKSQIMARLSNLKNAGDKYRTTSVRDDNTYEERQLIREYTEKARVMNENEKPTEFNYRVRGNPKNGLRIVRVPRT